MRGCIVDEAVENEQPDPGNPPVRHFYYSNVNGQPFLSWRKDGERRPLRPGDLARDQSIRSQRKDPDQYPEVTYLGSEYAKVVIYFTQVARFSPYRLWSDPLPPRHI